jgi:hypothetical protein
MYIKRVIIEAPIEDLLELGLGYENAVFLFHRVFMLSSEEHKSTA